jgi:hypothetical protein
VLYLFGDSTESNLDFNFLAFLREVIDTTVVLAECEVLLATTIEHRRTREIEADALVAAVDEFGERAARLVGPVAKEQTGTPVGRCAASIATSIRDAVKWESSQVRTALAASRDELDREDQRLQARARDALDKLLRTHDLPGAAKEVEVVWTATGVKATMRQRTSFGVEATLALDVPASSVLGLDLRVDRIAEGVEVHAVGAGGWLKKSEKLVALKIGRYLVVGVSVGAHVTVQLRATGDGNVNAGFAVTAYPDGELTIEPTGGGPALAIEERDRPGLRLLAERLEAAARSLGDNRAGLVSVAIDGKPLSEHGHPRVLAERLMIAIAPTVQQIAQHSRSPGELVLRRLLGDSRREEIFVPVAELLRRFDGLPAAAREVFAPLQLEVEPPFPQEPRFQASQPVEVKSAAVPLMIPDARSAPSRTAPPPFGTHDKPRITVPLPDPRRAARPSAPPPMAEFHDPDQDHEEDELTVVLAPSSALVASLMAQPTTPPVATPPVPSRTTSSTIPPMTAPPATTITSRTTSSTIPPPMPLTEAKAPLASARHPAVIVDDLAVASAEPAAPKRPDDATVGHAIDDDEELPSAT